MENHRFDGTHGVKMRSHDVDWMSTSTCPRNLQPTGPTKERTPQPEYPIALATYLGVRW